MNIEKMEHLEKVFSSMGNIHRLNILKMLSDRPLCVGAIVELLDISQPAVSQHLRILDNLGLIKGERRGNMVHYSVDSEFTEELISFLENLKKEDEKMCDDKEKCKKGIKPGDCSEEQIKECHGHVEEHECEERGECIEE